MGRHLLLALFGAAILLAGCAKVVLPSGGPRDVEPPKMLKEDPPSGTVNFDGHQIKITFDEFFTLNNPTDNVLISPPLPTAPKYTINGKTLLIKFADTLQPHATYNLVFTDCIKDFHEGNDLSYYHYSFSTGDAIDSCTLKGQVLDAYSLDGCKDFLVMLYRQDEDSLPLTSRPDYVTKSLSNGSFSFDNIAVGEYKLFALKDINANMIYDLPNEQIAFANQPVNISPTEREDSLASTAEEVLLYCFEKKEREPKLTRVENPAPGTYVIPYKSSFARFSAQSIGSAPDYFESVNKNQDTVFWYMKEPVTDTLTFVLNADNHLDTVYLTPYKAPKTTGRGSANVQTAKLTVTTQNEGHRYKPLTLIFPAPIKPADSIPIKYFTKRDTSVTWVSVPDTFVKQLELPLSLEEKQNYTVLIPDSVFWNYQGKTNDSIKLHFETHAAKDYGNLTMEYIHPDNSIVYIAQLWKDNSFLQEDLITTTSQVQYPALEPGNYRIKIIEDANHNGRWDAGDYHLKQQPEKIWFFPHAISIRAYWDSEEQFVIPEK